MNTLKPLALGALLATAPANAADFHLICRGSGTAIKADVATGSASDSNGNTASAIVTGKRESGFNAEVAVEIVEGVGRIRIPRNLLPPLHGGIEGWFDLTKLKETETELSASAAVNFMTSPKILINRVTGSIAIHGRNGSFAGQCQPFDPATQKRAF